MDPEIESPAIIRYNGGEAPSAAGWPLGLETMHVTVNAEDGMRGRELMDPLALATPSFSSLSLSSSDFDTESSKSFFPDKSVTLGSLIGLRSSRSARYASNMVHPEDQIEMCIVTTRSSCYGRAKTWKSFTGCIHFPSRLQNRALYLAQLLKAEKRGGINKVYMNAIYRESEGPLPGGTSPPFLDYHRNQPTGVNSQSRLGSLDLEIIEEGALTDDGKDSNTSAIVQSSCRQNRAESQGLCMPFLPNILLKLVTCRG